MNITEEHWKRLQRAEKKLDRLTRNPAPTVPKYDLVHTNTGGDGNGGGLTPPFFDYWITCHIKLNSTIINNQANDPGNDFFLITGGSGTGSPASDSGFDFGVAAQTLGGPVEWRVIGFSTSQQAYAGSVAADTDYLVEFHVNYVVADDTFNPQLFIDGVNQGMTTGLVAFFDPIGDSYCFFGTDVYDITSGDYVTQFHDIKIGTTRGSNNLFDATSMTNVIVPPFSAIIGHDSPPSLAFSASGGILTATVNPSGPAHGSDYVVAPLGS